MEGSVEKLTMESVGSEGASESGLSRGKVAENLLGPAGYKGMQARLKDLAERLHTGNDSKQRLSEGENNSEVLGQVAQELWLLRRMGKGIKADSEKGYYKTLLADIDEQAKELAASKQLTPESVMTLGRLQYAGVLKSEVVGTVRGKLEKLVTDKKALGRYKGDVTLVLAAARRFGVFEFEAEGARVFLKNKRAGSIFKNE